MSKEFIAIRTRYYKKEKAKSLDKHVRRKSHTTTNAYPHLSENNFSKQFRTKTSCNDEYFQINGRKTRSDFNEVFEHMGILSLDKFEELEKKYPKDKLQPALLRLVEKYALEIKDKYGFEPLRCDFHLDEGHYDENGIFKRNIHFHLQFYNYDFKNKLSPLKNIQKKVVSNIDLSTGEEVSNLSKEDLESGIENGKIKRILTVNPFFSDIQDIAARIFKPAGFRRGISKSITGKEHFSKDKYISEKHKEQEQQINQVNAEIESKNASKLDLEEHLRNTEAELTELKEQLKTGREDLSDLSNELRNAKKTIKRSGELIVESEEQDQIFDIFGKKFTDLLITYDNYENKPIEFKKELSEEIDKKVDNLSENYDGLSVKGKIIFNKLFNLFIKVLENIEKKLDNKIFNDHKISTKLKEKIKI